ncbi:MAG: hypothetical protein U9N11_00565 [Campylobacterota bacterium]|nr:hypothetical protein [Campylobacterota bacterium]
MDKTQPLCTNVRHRQGFALMITLSVLAILIALTIVLLGYFKEVQKDAKNTTALIQANVFYADILTAFNAIGNKQTLLSKIYTYPPSMRSGDGKFALNLRCLPLSSGVNVNWLAFGNVPDMKAQYAVTQELFEMIDQEYNIEDADLLLEMLLEEIGGRKKFIKREYSRLRQKNGIISYEQFSGIVSRYQIEADDKKVGRVPWNKYFTFSSEATRIDVKYSSPELISYLFEIDLSTVKEWFYDPKRPSLKYFVSDNGGNYMSRQNIITGNKLLEETVCKVSFLSAGKRYRFKFDYIKGEAKRFEFYEKK